MVLQERSNKKQDERRVRALIQTWDFHTTNSKCSIPLYGRAFENTTGIEKPFSGVGAGSWTDGVWDVKVLPFSGTVVTEDLGKGASYSYGNSLLFIAEWQSQQ